jgi:hypothetical protein
MYFSSNPVLVADNDFAIFSLPEFSLTVELSLVPTSSIGSKLGTEFKLNKNEVTLPLECSWEFLKYLKMDAPTSIEL